MSGLLRVLVRYGLVFFVSSIPFSCVPKSTVDVSSSETEATPKVKTVTVESDPVFYCPAHFKLMKFESGNPAFCVEINILAKDLLKGGLTKAVGPFPEGMIKRCQGQGGGKACEATDDVRWVANFAIGLRGAERCPAGTQHNKEFETCVDESYAYGPFKHQQVEKCKQIAAKQSLKAKYKIACESMRWSKNYFPREQIQKLFFNQTRRLGPDHVELDLKRFKPLKQNEGKSCGRTNVAMMVNYITGQSLIDQDFPSDGFGVAQSLNNETYAKDVIWVDAGNLTPETGPYFWPQVEKAIADNLPVVIALNGPHFSPSGNGHIITLVGLNGSKVKYADSGSGQIKDDTNKTEIENAQGYPQGNFIILPQRRK